MHDCYKNSNLPRFSLYVRFSRRENRGKFKLLEKMCTSKSFLYHSTSKIYKYYYIPTVSENVRNPRPDVF